MPLKPCDQSSDMPKPIRRRLEDAFRDALRDLLPTDTILSAGDTVEAEAPYIVVRCPRVEETTPGSFIYLFFLRLAPVSNVNDSNSSSAHDDMVKRLQDAVAQLPKAGHDETNGVILRGWTITEDESAEDEDQTYADVLAIEGGCASSPEVFG
jgi:hypothetical protein